MAGDFGSVISVSHFLSPLSRVFLVKSIGMKKFKSQLPLSDRIGEEKNRVGPFRVGVVNSSTSEKPLHESFMIGRSLYLFFSHNNIHLGLAI